MMNDLIINGIDLFYCYEEGEEAILRCEPVANARIVKHDRLTIKWPTNQCAETDKPAHAVESILVWQRVKNELVKNVKDEKWL